MEPLNITNFEIKRDNANVNEVPNQKNGNRKDESTSKSNRDMDIAIVKGLFEDFYNNFKTK